VLLAAYLLLCPTTLLAQVDPSHPARERASAHFQRGVELFQDGAYRAALVEFQRAYETSPNYRLLYNIGQTQFELQDFLGATQSYEQFLAEGGTQVSPKLREELEIALQSLRTRVGRVTISVNRDGADVFLDDTEIGKSPITSTVSVNVGQHRVAARAPDGAEDSKVIDVAGGEVAQVSLELEEAAPVAAVGAPIETGRPVAIKLAIAGWSAGTALLLGSIVTGTMAHSADSDLDEMLGSVNVDAGRVDDQRNKVEKMVLSTDIMIGAGAALAVVGTVLYFVGRKELKSDRKARRASGLHLNVGLGSLEVRGRF
jgi:hypothetical protein